MTVCSKCGLANAVAVEINDGGEDVAYCSRCLASYDLDASELADRIAEERKRLVN